jgi:hypothetical protein
MEQRVTKVKIIGTNNLFKDLLDNKFSLKELLTTPTGVHYVKLVDYEHEIFFDASSRIKFSNNMVCIEGFAQVNNSLGNLSILIIFNEADDIV